MDGSGSALRVSGPGRKESVMSLRAACLATFLFGAVRLAGAQSAPDIVWSAPTPGLGVNNVQAVAWSPTADNLAVGSSDRWFRLREASTGALLYSVLEPKNSGGPGTILYSKDGLLVGVRNEASGLKFRVQRTADGLFLGSVVATIGANGLISFAPDVTLLLNTGGDGTISSWDFSDLTLFQVTGSGYQTVTTTFNFSPDGLLQTAAVAKTDTITVRRTSDGAIVKVLRGGAKVVFSPDSSLLAAWDGAPVNQILVWQTSNWAVVHRLPFSNPVEGVSGLRFTPDGLRLVTTGYFPFQTQAGWQQKGIIRFFVLATDALLVSYDQQTDIAVTSPAAFSPDGSKFVYGLYNGTLAVANTPP
jgi:WD40 repeat protein